ncbi:MAG: NTP transferase domain-containing protein [Spirochaetes bacterium]|nr:NTP transferase domain-containing protein [Spirochaetota bacterium]
MLAVILQARLDSSRLNAKALLPLGGKPIIFRVMQALNRVPADLRILACPADALAFFAPLADEAGFEVFEGPKEDVLERYCLAIRHFGITRVIRATGDNPFVFADSAEAINAEAVATNADYAAYTGLPHGAGVEAVLAAALLRAQAQTAPPGDHAYEREHVCPYLYGHPEMFRLHRPGAGKAWQGENGQAIRLTVDTPDDYQRAELLYNALPQGEERYSGRQIIRTYKETFPE